MTKQWIVLGIVGGLALLIVGGIVGIWLSLPKFEVENKSSVKRFNVSTIWGNVFLWKMGYLNQVDRVKVIYTDEPQQTFQLNSVDDKEVMSTNLEILNKNITITIRYDKEKINELEQRPYWFSRDIYAGICMVFEENKLTEVEDCYQKAMDYVEWSKAKKIPGVIVNKKILGFNLVQQAYAQSCAGIIPCGQMVYNQSHCVGGPFHNQSCTITADCNGGSCVFGNYCDTSLNTMQCGGVNQAVCLTSGVSRCATGCNNSPEFYCAWSTSGGGGGGGGTYCHIGMVNPTVPACPNSQVGLNRKVYDSGIQDNNHLTQNDYTCGPRIDDLTIGFAGSGTNLENQDSCGTVLAKFNGYFYASVAGNYQFLVDVFPNGGFSIDGVNGVPVDNDPLPCTSANGLRRVGDRYWAQRYTSCGSSLPGWAKNPLEVHDGDPHACRNSDNEYMGAIPGNLFATGTFHSFNDNNGQAKFWGTWPYPWYVPYPAPAGNGTVSGADHPTSAPYIPPYYTQDAWRTPESSECIYNSPSMDQSGFIVPTGNMPDDTNDEIKAHGDFKVRIWARRYLTQGYHRVEGWHYWSRWELGNPDNVGTPNNMLDFYVKRPGDPSFVRTRDLPLDASCPFTACDGTPVCTAAPPAAPTAMRPQDGATNVYRVRDTTSVNFSWTHSGSWGTGCPNTTRSFEFCMGTNSALVTNFQGCTIVGVAGGGPRIIAASNSAPATITGPQNVTVGNNGETYYWRVRATNSSLTSPAALQTLYAPIDITMNLYRGMSCNDGTTALSGNWSYNLSTNIPGFGAYVRSGNVTAASSAQATRMPSNITTLFSAPSLPPNYVQRCPNGVWNTPNLNVDRTVSTWAETAAARWWQAYGGDVGARRLSGNISNTVPTAAAATNWTMMDLSAGPESEGVLLYSGSYTSTNPNSGQHYNWRAQTPLAFDDTAEHYASFIRSFEMNPTTSTIASDGDINQTDINGNPAPNPAFFHNGPVTINSNLTISGSKVVFVNNNVTINADTITVAPGNFFAIVASGSITFSGNTRNIQGIYLADTTLTVARYTAAQNNTEHQFTGEGIFIGWGGVSLQRDLNNPPNSDALVNNVNPSHIFRYRPDFLINAPDGFKTSSIQWQEVDPQKELTP